MRVKLSTNIPHLCPQPKSARQRGAKCCVCHSGTLAKTSATRLRQQTTTGAPQQDMVSEGKNALKPARRAVDPGGESQVGCASWAIDADTSTVRLVSSSGTVTTEALDVWTAQYEGNLSINGSPCSPPSMDLPDITFHAEMGSVNLQIRRTATDQRVLVPVVSDSSSEYPLPDVPQFSQVLAENNWFALDQGQCAEIKTTLSEQGILPHTVLSDQQVLWLSWKSGLDVSFSAMKSPAVPSREETPLKSVGRLTADLYPYQAQGFQRLRSLYAQNLGCLLADEMGLGKTLQVIALLSAVCDSGTSLVVGPASTLANWSREFSRFAPSLNILVHQGSARTGRPSSLTRADVVVTSYESIVQDLTLFEQVHWNVIALDEAQAIKNPMTKRALAVKHLDGHSHVAVTGTPIENSLRDLWAIMEFVASAYLPSFEVFQDLYPDEIWAAEHLGELVSPLVIRRNVDQVAADLPDRIDAFVPLTLDGTVAAEYNAIRVSPKPVLAKMTALRVCAASAKSTTNSSKMRRLTEIAEEAFATGKKVLVFASFANSIDEIASYFRGVPGLFIATLDGRTNIGRRQELIDEYTDHPGPGILVVNPRAAGVGLNIQAANYVVHFTPEWNPAVVDQASARSYRRGQLLPVFVYYLYYEQTIESVMIERLSSKRELQSSGMSRAMDGPDKAELEKILDLVPKEIT